MAWNRKGDNILLESIMTPFTHSYESQWVSGRVLFCYMVFFLCNLLYCVLSLNIATRKSFISISSSLLGLFVTLLFNSPLYDTMPSAIPWDSVQWDVSLRICNEPIFLEGIKCCLYTFVIYWPFYYSDIPWHIKSLLVHLSIKLFRRATKRNTNTPHHWPYVMGVWRWPADSSHKGPLMRKTFSCHDVTMNWSVHRWWVCTRWMAPSSQWFPIWRQVMTWVRVHQNARIGMHITRWAVNVVCAITVKVRLR